MRQAYVYYNDDLAGILTETYDGEYLFQYDEAYIANYPDQFLTFTMPVTSTHSPRLRRTRLHHQTNRPDRQRRQNTYA